MARIVLSDLAREWRDSRFVWGETDCCQRIVTLVARHTGRDDLIAEHRGAYTDEAGAEAYLAARGGLLRVVRDEMRRCGVPRVPARRAEAGDVVVARIAEGLACGVFDGRFVMLARREGFALMPARIVAAWRL